MESGWESRVPFSSIFCWLCSPRKQMGCTGREHPDVQELPGSGHQGKAAAWGCPWPAMSVVPGEICGEQSTCNACVEPPPPCQLDQMGGGKKKEVQKNSRGFPETLQQTCLCRENSLQVSENEVCHLPPHPYCLFSCLFKTLLSYKRLLI